MPKRRAGFQYVNLPSAASCFFLRCFPAERIGSILQGEQSAMQLRCTL